MKQKYLKGKILFLLMCCCMFKAIAQNVPLGSAAKYAILAGQSINANTKAHASDYAGAGLSISSNITATSALNPYSEDLVPEALSNLEFAMDYCWGLESTTINNSNLNESAYEEGIYSLNETGTIGQGEIILNGDQNSVFIFNIDGDLVVEEGAIFSLGDIKPENIYWNVTGEVIIGKDTQFPGIVLAHGDITYYVPSGLPVSLLSLASINITATDLNEAFHFTNFYSFNKLSSALGFCDPPQVKQRGWLFNSVKGRVPEHLVEFTSFGTSSTGHPYSKAYWELELTDVNNVVYSVITEISTPNLSVYVNFTDAFIAKYGFSIPCGTYTARDRFYNSCTQNSAPFISGPHEVNVNCFSIALPNASICQNSQTNITATVIKHPNLTGNFAYLNNNLPSPIRWYWNNILKPNATGTTVTIPSSYTSQAGQFTLKTEMDLFYNGYTVTESQSAIITVGGVANNAQVLGDPYKITTFDASQQGGSINFSGDYHVVGHLEFKNGTFTLEPGTKFYIDPDVLIPFDVNGAYRTIINVSNATLNIIGATLTTSDCNYQSKWGGIIVSDGSAIYSNRGGLPLKNAEISFSVFAVRSQQTTTVNNPTPVADVYYPNSNFYDLNYTDFLNNSFSFTDVHKNAAAQTGEGIRNCKFYDSQVGIHFAWDDQTNSSYGGDFTNAVFSGNTFNNSSICAMYGIANNVTIANNDFFGNNAGVVVSPEITATSARTTITGNNFVIPAGKMGVNAEYRYTIKGNSFAGGIASGYAAGAMGIQAWGAGNEIADGNTFSKLETGLSILPNQDAVARGNVFTNNLNGVFFPHDAYAFSSATVRCNTFSAPALNTTTHGILVNTGSTLAQLGTASLPNGNKFDGTVAQPVTNDGTTSLTYYKYGSSTQENLGFQIYGTRSGSISQQAGNPATACSGQGAGITARQGGGAITYLNIRNMMDSLRLNLGSFAELKYFQREIMSYHTQSNLLADLETYCHTLQGVSQEAYNTIGLYLMETYRAKGQEQQAQMLKSTLVHYNQNDLEITYRAKYFDLTGKWGSSFPQNLLISSADSTTLAVIAGSGTTPALKACTTLRMFYPQLTTCQAPANASLRTVSPSSLARKATEAGSLGLGYPNPAQEEVVIPYALPNGCKAASIQINEVLTGRQVRSYDLKAGESSLTVDLHNLKTGLYTYTLFIESKPAGTRKLSVVK